MGPRAAGARGYRTAAALGTPRAQAEALTSAKPEVLAHQRERHVVHAGVLEQGARQLERLLVGPRIEDQAPLVLERPERIEGDELRGAHALRRAPLQRTV